MESRSSPSNIEVTFSLVSFKLVTLYLMISNLAKSNVLYEVHITFSNLRHVLKNGQNVCVKRLFFSVGNMSWAGRKISCVTCVFLRQEI